MFSRDELLSFDKLRDDYSILCSNCHDIRLKSRLTGHEWIVISPYGRGSCEILHRHSGRDPFHHQKGLYPTLSEALEYIKNHDAWCIRKRNSSACEEA